jgi:hypothetical protein
LIGHFPFAFGRRIETPSSAASELVRASAPAEQRKFPTFAFLPTLSAHGRSASNATRPLTTHNFLTRGGSSKVREANPPGEFPAGFGEYASREID